MKESLMKEFVFTSMYLTIRMLRSLQSRTLNRRSSNCPVFMSILRHAPPRVFVLKEDLRNKWEQNSLQRMQVVHLYSLRTIHFGIVTGWACWLRTHRMSSVTLLIDSCSVEIIFFADRTTERPPDTMPIYLVGWYKQPRITKRIIWKQK